MPPSETNTAVARCPQGNARGRSIAVVTALSAWMLLVGGCGILGRSSATTKEPAALSSAIELWGGIEALDAVEEIRANALVEVYNESGTSRVQRYRIAIDPAEGTMEASGREPGGSWSAVVDIDGGGRVDADDSLGWSDADKVGLLERLRLLLHRVRGPFNLRDEQEQPGGGKNVYAGSYPMTRVLSGGRPALASAYFFDMESSELRMITAGDYELPGDGSVTLYGKTRRLEHGVLVPIEFEVVRLGKNSFIGDRKELTVKLSDLSPR